MTLDEQDLRQGLKFICGTWQVDYVVNAFSGDLAHIPAKEFKSKDGKDFSGITYEFTEDHAVIMRDATSDKTENGTWEQTGFCDYHYTLNGFIDVPDGPFKDNAEKLLVQDGCLCFSIGFLAIGMKKIADGTVTEPEDPKNAEMSEEDAKADGIVGKYIPVKVMTMIGDDFGLFTEEEVRADLTKKIDAGKTDEEEAAEMMNLFTTIVEFTADHRMLTWSKIPDDVSDEDIQEAINSGEIGEVVDRHFCADEKAWKFVNGVYYYDSGESGTAFGEEISPWKEITFDENGYLPFQSGMILLKKI